MRRNRATPTLSVYSNRPPEDAAGREALRLELQHALDAIRDGLATAPKSVRTSFAECERILRQAASTADGLSRAPATAAFAGADGSVLIEPLAIPVQTAASWRTGPRVTPLLAAALQSPALVVLVDSEHRTIFRLIGDALVAVETHDDRPMLEPAPHMGAIPRAGFHSGTRGETQTDAAERIHREAHLRHAHRTAERISALAGSTFDVVVGGGAGTVQLVVESLPTAVRRRTIATESLRMNSNGPDIVRVARAAQRELAAIGQRALLTDLLNDARHAHRSAIGLTEVANAAAASAVDHLLVSRALARSHANEVDAVVDTVLLDGGVVEFVDGEPGATLDANAQGIVARLRFAAPLNHLTALPALAEPTHAG